MSTIKVDTIQNASGVEVYTAKAWVNWDQVTPSIRNDGNVSSVTDNASGDATFNFSNSFSAATYSVALSSNGASTRMGAVNVKTSTIQALDATYTTSSVTTLATYNAGLVVDLPYQMLHVTL